MLEHELKFVRGKQLSSINSVMSPTIRIQMKISTQKINRRKIIQKETITNL